MTYTIIYFLIFMFLFFLCVQYAITDIKNLGCTICFEVALIYTLFLYLIIYYITNEYKIQILKKTQELRPKNIIGQLNPKPKIDDNGFLTKRIMNAWYN